jgi:hypothetical protein
MEVTDDGCVSECVAFFPLLFSYTFSRKKSLNFYHLFKPKLV